MLNKIIKFFLHNRFITLILLLTFICWGIITSPFQWDISILPKNPVPVDAIPDIGENQQIVFTKWPGRSPQDIEDQITYPLTTSLLGMPGIKTIRGSSMFGFSSIYVIFDDNIEFYWSRTRILEKLNSLSTGLLPEGVQPMLGPDATALGQIFWYTLEGRNNEGEPTGGWDLQELRSIQDYQIRYSLASVKGVSEVASIGGYVKEYQVDIDPNAMKAYNINLNQIINSIKNSNLDIGARTIEINQAEYFVRGIGYIKNIEDLELSIVAVNNNVPVRIKDVAKVKFGPSERRGALDKMGAEVVGGVVVARYGENPLKVINGVKSKIEELSTGLPQKTLDNGEISKINIIPFYDRTKLIKETLGTLENALSLEIIITIIVIIVMVMNLRASILISSLIPIAVLMCFIAMRNMGVDANIVALSGIAIAIGTIVDVGIVLSENMIQHQEKNTGNIGKLQTIYNATIEVAPAVLTAVLTTIVSFIPVFTLQAAEGKLFRPLAFTKTFVLVSSIIVAITILPTLAYWLFSFKINKKQLKKSLNILLVVLGISILIFTSTWIGWILIIAGAFNLTGYYYPRIMKYSGFGNILIIVLAVTYFLAKEWLPLGASNSLFTNYLFVMVIISSILVIMRLFIKYYTRILAWALAHKLMFLSIPLLLVIWALVIWLGFNSVFGFVGDGLGKIGLNVRKTTFWETMYHKFPGTGKEFMPALDEGSFLLMPTSMPHSGIEENKRILKQLDIAVESIPEVDMVVGKLGRVESPLDPAPISMYENVISYKSEYITDENGRRLRFKYGKKGFLRDDSNNLIPDKKGKYFRQWREKIKSPDDIWDEIISVSRIPGVTSAPKLQPIETRLVMLQTGMRAPIGIKLQGNDLKTLEDFGIELEKKLKNVSGVKATSVFAERIVGKPYIEININREIISIYGLTINEVQKNIAVAIGGVILNKTVEGRERYPVRIRYPREFRDSPEMLGKVLISTPVGAMIPLTDLADIEYVQGPQVIKSENTFLISYVIFDKIDGFSEVDVVNNAKDYLNNLTIEGLLEVPAGISYSFTGNYENQIRAEKRLSVVIPLVMIIIFIILYLQFKKVQSTLLVFSGIAVAFAGGFIMIWLYGQEWFMNFSLFEYNMRELFQMKPVFLSVAVWVGFIALFGIATDDGVIMTTYLDQSFKSKKPQNKLEIRETVILAGSKRIRPCLMTTATTILALLPILTSTGRGADVMVPMAIPAFGGMSIELITLFVIPVLYSSWKEKSLLKKEKVK